MTDRKRRTLAEAKVEMHTLDLIESGRNYSEIHLSVRQVVRGTRGWNRAKLGMAMAVARATGRDQ